MAKRVIIKNETIPNIGKVLGQTSMTYKTGGNTASSFNSTNLFNFDVKEEGEIEVKDPQRSYLTTTFYPLLFIDKLGIKADNVSNVILTDNLYATHGLSDDIVVGATNLDIVVFKKALFVIDYYSNSFAKRDSIKFKATDIQIVLRDVLKKYSIKNENLLFSPKSISFSIRSVLINYVYYKPEAMFFTYNMPLVTNRLYSSKFISLLVADSKNVGLVVNNDVTLIKDKGALTWAFTKNMQVNEDARFDQKALVMEEAPSYLQSNESLNITSEDGIEILFEDWIKPTTSTKSLLTSYNNISTLTESPLLTDKIDGKVWTVTGAGFNAINTDYVLTDNNSLKREAVLDTFKIENPITSSKGYTIEFNCTVEGTDRIYLLSNNTTTLSNSLKTTFALVWYGGDTPEVSHRNKLAIIGDDPLLVDSFNHMVLSSSSFATGSDIQISIIFYNNYIKLFINGVLEGVKLIDRSFDLGSGGFLKIGAVSWYTYKAAHKLTLNSFRLSSTTTHLDNSYVVPSKYNLYALPDILKIGTPTKYLSGLTCGVRYLEEGNVAKVFVSITDSNDTTFEVTSSVLDISKWNYIQVANTKNEVTLFVNGVASGSMILPYNIKLKDIVIGSKENSSYKGKMDNFRIYSKLQDNSNPLRSSELFFTHQGIENTKLFDSNLKLNWLKNVGTVLQTTSNSTYRSRELVGGLKTKDTAFIINPYNFKIKTVLNNISYKNTEDVIALDTPTTFTGNTVTYPQTLNMADDAISLTFKQSVSSVETLLTLSSLTLTTVVVDSSTYNLKLTINGTETLLSYAFKINTSYELSLFKTGGILHIFADKNKLKSLPVSTILTTTSLIVGPFTGEVSKIKTSVVSTTKATLLDNYDTSEGQGFLAVMYEPFKGMFLTECYFDPLTKATSSSLVPVGYNTFEFIFKNKTMSITTNSILSDTIPQVSYLKGSDTFSILEVNKTPLAYFEVVSSEQDALLPVPYKLDAVINESVYTNAVISISSDAGYENNNVFDRSSRGLAKDVINTNVSKGIKQPGYFFNGQGANLKVTASEFGFGLDDFYIECECYLTSLANRAVLLDTYSTNIGSWQLSVNTDGHLYFTITKNTDGSYDLIDVPTNITVDEWYKIQVSRSGQTIKIYLNDTLAYEYSNNSIINFADTVTPLYIGTQGTRENTAYSTHGYMNNIRVVKGLSLELKTDEESLLIEKIKDNINEPFIKNLVTQLVGEPTWVLDPANNRIKYTNPVDPTNPTGEYIWKFNQFISSNAVDVCKMIHKGQDQWSWQHHSVEYVDINNANCVAIMVQWNNQLSRTPISRVLNPSYDPTVDNEEKYLPLPTVAQKVISNAEAGDLQSQVFIGERKLTSEQYDIYKSSSDTLLNIFVKGGAFYDYKNNIWEGKDSLLIEEGQSTNYNRWFVTNQTGIATGGLSLKSTEDFTLETSLLIPTIFETRTPIISLASTISVSIEAVNKGFVVSLNGTEYIVPHQIRNNIWYKIALCKKKNTLFIYIDNYLYRLPDNSSVWTVSNGSFSIPSSPVKIEAVKLSNKCSYKNNKGKENMYLDTHLSLSKNKVDNGNNPVSVTVTNTTKEAVLNKPFYLDSYEVMGVDSVVSLGSALKPSKNPFSMELNLMFSRQNVLETILSFTTDTLAFSLYKDVDNKLKVSLTIEAETTITESSYSVVPFKWYFLNLTRDLGNLLAINIEGVVDYVAGFNYDLTPSNLVVSGFSGGLNSIKIYNNYTVDSKSSFNLLKVDFENDTLKTDYASDVYNSKLIQNNNVSVVKGLSKTSDLVGYFDGLSSYLSFGKDAYFNINKSDFEVSFNIYPTNGTNNYQTILSSGSDELTNFFITMYGNTYATNNRISVGVNGDPFLIGNISLVYNEWASIKVERKNGVFYLYINNVLDKAVANDVNVNMNINETIIGKNKWDGGEGYFQGYLDDIKIAREGSYKENTTIDVTEGLISGLDFEDVGAGYDVIEVELDGNIADAYANTWILGRYDNKSKHPTLKTVSAINDAMYFEDKGYMYCYNKHFAIGLDPFTISIDFMQTKRSVTEANIFQVYGLYTIVINSAGYLTITISGVTHQIALINLDTFYSVAITRDAAKTLRIFLDGKIVKTLSNVVTNYDYGTGAQYPATLGIRFDLRAESSSYQNYYFTGYIDNFIFDRGVCRYTQDYSVYIDKAEKLKYQSFVEFKENGVTSFPDLAEHTLSWTAVGLSTVSVGNKYTTFSGRNTLNSSYMNSTAHGLSLGYKDFSLDIIFKPQQTTAETCLLDLSLNTGITQGLRVLQHNSSTSAITVEIGETGATEWTASMTTGINTIVANQVYHLRVVRNLGTIYVYLDGILKSSLSYLSDINIGTTFSLFNNRARNRGFTGNIEQFRFIVDKAITTTTSFTPLTESLK